jgi:DNA polymerase III alpha subunit
MLLWEVDSIQETPRDVNTVSLDFEPPSRRAAEPPRLEPPLLREYTTDRRRHVEYELLGFTTDSHPMHLHAADLARFRVTKSTKLADHVGESVLCCGMLTTSKPISTITEEPMEFATFDDGYGLIETVLFPRVFRERGHVLFDQGPFIFRGKVDEEFGAITVAITGIDRLERMVEKADRAG